MARYFFNTVDRGSVPDTEGTELRDHAAARKYAVMVAGEVMRSDPDVLWDGQDFMVKVTDRDDLLLFTITAYATNAP